MGGAHPRSTRTPHFHGVAPPLEYLFISRLDNSEDFIFPGRQAGRLWHSQVRVHDYWPLSRQVLQKLQRLPPYRIASSVSEVLGIFEMSP